MDTLFRWCLRKLLREEFINLCLKNTPPWALFVLILSPVKRVTKNLLTSVDLETDTIDCE